MEGRDQSGREDVADFHAGQSCRTCGAWAGELGHEPTPDLWAEHIVEVFAEAWRVLRKDGVVWANFGDCYAGSGFSGGTRAADEKGQLVHRPRAGGAVPTSPGLKPKDLVGQPWLAAFALRRWGWYLRQEIIWHKPNPMPESVTDRCTKSHEQVFLLSREPRYFYDNEAVREVVTGNSHPRGPGNKSHKGQAAYEEGNGEFRTRAGLLGYSDRQRAKHKTPDGWDTTSGEGGHGSFHKNGREKGVRKLAEPGSGTKTNSSFDEAVKDLVDDRNKRSVWTIATEPFAEAHFATFPTGLVRPCVLAGSRKGDTILDIFGGSGTVGEVSLEYGRNCILIDIDPKNKEFMLDRIAPFVGQGHLI